MKRITEKNGYNEAVLIEAKRANSFADALEKLYLYEELPEGKYYFNEYEYLLYLEDDDLEHEIHTNNNIQNALKELLELAKELVYIQE